MKRTPLRPKRERLRRNDGRVQYVRMKPKAGASASPQERQHMAYVASLPCIVCGRMPVTVHHVTGSAYGRRISRSHKRTVPLCPVHHLIQHGPRESVEALGHAGFFRTYGINLLAEGHRIWVEAPHGLAERSNGPDPCPDTPES